MTNVFMTYGSIKYLNCEIMETTREKYEIPPCLKSMNFI